MTAGAAEGSPRCAGALAGTVCATGTALAVLSCLSSSAGVGGGRYVGGRPGGVYCVPASTYPLLRPWGEGSQAGTGEGAAIGCLGVCGASYRRAAAVLTAKRGECALEEAEARREA